MILDTKLTRNQKIQVSMIVGALWIYFRTQDCYALLPRKSVVSVILVAAWIYANYQEPLFLPLGLCAMIVYSFLFKK